jgi:predicted metal-dependent hydrolase
MKTSSILRSFQKTIRDIRSVPDVVLLSVNGETLPVKIRKNHNAKRYVVRLLNATGEFQLTTPTQTNGEKITKALKEYAPWIATQRQRWLAKDRPTLDGHGFGIGQTFPLRGVMHTIAVNPAAKSVVAQNGVVVITTERESALRVRRFLTREAAADLKIAVARYAAQLGVSIDKITVRDTKSRWGSCSSNGSLNFSWRLILAPSFILDYVAAHEVAHRVEMNHSDRYWAVLEGIYPQWQKAEDWLKQHGAELHHYG